MKNCAFLLGLAVIMVVMCGCRNLPEGFVKDTHPGKTKYDVHSQTTRVIELDRQDLLSDWNHFWLLEKPTRLNELRLR